MLTLTLIEEVHEVARVLREMRDAERSRPIQVWRATRAACNMYASWIFATVDRLLGEAYNYTKCQRRVFNSEWRTHEVTEEMLALAIEWTGVPEFEVTTVPQQDPKLFRGDTTLLDILDEDEA